MSRARNRVPFIVPLLVLIGSVALAERPSQPGLPSATGITVGEFALQVARLAADNPADRASLTPERALTSLRRAGLRLRGAPGAVLTEGDIADFFRQAGLSLSVSVPDRPLPADKAAATLSNFGGYLASRASDPARILATAIPQRSGNPSLDDLSAEDCLAEVDLPACLACCQELTGTTNSRLCGRGCGRSHAAQQVSASEPTP